VREQALQYLRASGSSGDMARSRSKQHLFSSFKVQRQPSLTVEKPGAGSMTSGAVANSFNAASPTASEQFAMNADTRLNMFKMYTSTATLGAGAKLALPTEAQDCALQLDELSQFDLPVSPYALGGETVGPLQVRGWGAFQLKGISVPVPLASLSLAELAGRAQEPKAKKWEFTGPADQER